MEKINGKNRSSQPSKKRQNSQLEVRNGSLGTFPGGSSEYGFNQIPVGREDSDKPNIFVSGQWSTHGIPGKIVGQLIEENEKQLAYHEQQAELIRGRIKQLKEIPETLQDINHKE
ncbi:MAG: hypothetical protein RM049_13545 [Nostoc sp. DedQUE04]|uniref:hypothetical protein n=1 Tax=Nostoc sp. DedQUE04 TaxID=3075390 RepID=UPI002AD5B0F5|nr:hypothetical protein [Nostoc sp. DedQUE04]MDZ8136311.1 hypothetical protein [Nostoc sp. DedQUE04]